MRFRLYLGSAGTLFRLLLSNCTVQVQEIIAARCNNYCSALTNLGFSFFLTGQYDFPWWMFTVTRFDECVRCTNLLQRAALINAAPWNLLTLALGLLISSPSLGQWMKNFQWMCIFGCLWCNSLLQRAAIINAAPWNLALDDCRDWVLTWTGCEHTLWLSVEMSRCNNLLQRRCNIWLTDRFGEWLGDLRFGSLYQV